MHPTRLIKTINDILRMNRGILNDLLSSKASIEVTSDVLDTYGFNPGYCTHMHEAHGTMYLACYDVAYTAMENGMMSIIRLEEQ